MLLFVSIFLTFSLVFLWNLLGNDRNAKKKFIKIIIILLIVYIIFCVFFEMPDPKDKSTITMRIMNTFEDLLSWMFFLFLPTFAFIQSIKFIDNNKIIFAFILPFLQYICGLSILLIMLSFSMVKDGLVISIYIISVGFVLIVNYIILINKLIFKKSKNT